jgi:acyl dehydratase
MFRRGYAVLRCLCDGVAERLHRVDVRFTSPVYPGETLRTEIWRQERGIAAFRVRVDERDLIVLNNGRAEFQT